MADHGHFFWNELMTHDAAAAKAFYGATLGWSFDAMPMPASTGMPGADYIVCKADDAAVGGIFEMKGPGFEGVPAHWLSHVAVDDVDSRVEKLRAAGGEVLRPPFDVEEVGRIAIVKDPVGAVLGLITPSGN